MPDLIRFSDLKDSQPLTLDGNNDLFAIAVKNPSSETGYTSMTVKPNMIAGYVAEDATYANLKTGSTDGDNTIVKAINKTLSNFADEFNTTAGSTYAMGDCTLYNGLLYQCSNSSGTTSGTFIPADWTQIKSVDVGSGGGSSGDHITLTQAEYDALVQAGTVDPNAYYFIEDAVFPSYAHNYSTTEHIIGTWIDGSTIYEKTIYCDSFPDNTSKTLTTPQDLDMLIDAFGFMRSKTQVGHYRTLPFAGGGTNDVRVDLNSGDLRVVTFANWTDYDGYITIRYTKSV